MFGPSPENDARVMGHGNLEWIFGAMGTHLTKNFSDIDLVEPGSAARMSGFYFTNGKQHLDHDTQQNHLSAKYDQRFVV